MLASVEVQTALLVLKICFLVLLYLFIWRIVRSASRDVRMPQESFIMGPQQAAAAGLGRQAQAQAIDSGVLVTVRSNALEQGSRFELNAKAITLGRAASNDIRLGDDEFASSRHARIEPRRDGVWVEDIGSTNGTYVNGTRLGRAHKLTHGDVVRVGETDLQVRTDEGRPQRGCDASRPEATSERGRVRLRAAALRDRGRDGRGARRRGRVGTCGGGATGATT